MSHFFQTGLQKWGLQGWVLLEEKRWRENSGKRLREFFFFFLTMESGCQGVANSGSGTPPGSLLWLSPFQGFSIPMKENEVQQQNSL